MITSNSDLPSRLGALIAGKTVVWVMEDQPVRWEPDRWTAHWQELSLPCFSVLRELESEFREHRTIRRKFLFETYQDRPATELFTAVMAWGLGLSNYGPSRASRILTQPRAARVIEDVVSAARQDGAAAGYRTYYAEGNTLQGLDVAFITKLIHFAGYESAHRPRPLIYDKRVATTITRLPTAPLLPDIEDGVTTIAYERYCQWAEDTAAEHRSDPAVVEWALYALGDEIRETLRAERASQRSRRTTRSTNMTEQ